jgi:hypothetical protein
MKALPNRVFAITPIKSDQEKYKYEYDQREDLVGVSEILDRFRQERDELPENGKEAVGPTDDDENQPEREIDRQQD